MLRVASQEIDRKREHRAHGLVSGEEHGDDLVAELGIAHVCAGPCVDRFEERGDQVRGATALSPALLDEAHDVPIDAVDRGPVAPAAGYRHPSRQRSEQHPAQDEVERVADLAGDVVRVVRVELGAEDRAHVRLHGEPAQLGREVHGPSRVGERVPARHAISDGARQVFDHGRVPVAVKLRLDHAALPPPEVALAHRQPVAE